MSNLPERIGARPETTIHGSHCQTSDQSPPEIWGKLIYRAFLIDGVYEDRSNSLCREARAVALMGKRVTKSLDSSIVHFRERIEPIHIHHVYDTSIHIALPAQLSKESCRMGWGEPDPYGQSDNQIMLYGPRNEAELEIIISLLEQSVKFAISRN